MQKAFNSTFKPLSATIVFIPILLADQITVIGNEMAFKHQDLQTCGLKFNKCMSDFHPLEVVGGGSKKQLQEG